MEICHQTGNGRVERIRVASSAVDAHMAHGDFTPASWWQDADSDGYGAEGAGLLACEAPDGFVERAGDCADDDAAVNPAALERCNLVDDDCDGRVDEDLGSVSCGVGVCARVLPACDGGQAPLCDPFEGAEAELCDGLDNDCDGAVDEDGVCDGPSGSSCNGGVCGANPPCGDGSSCGSYGICVSVAEGGGLCVNGATSCSALMPCGSTLDCGGLGICVVDTCCGQGVCIPPNLVCGEGNSFAAASSGIRVSGGATLGSP